MKHQKMELDGKTVSYDEAGNRKKPVLICLHGLAGSAAYSFSELSQKLSAYFHLILIDQPGHGRSSSFPNEEDYLFSNLAAWYEKVFSTLVDKPFYILGHSWGADVALHYAKHYPDKVNGIILLDGAFTFPLYQDDMTFETAYEGWNSYLDNANYSNWENILREYRNYTKRWNPTIEQSVSTIFNKNETYELIASKNTILPIIQAFFSEPFTDAYPVIKSPLLLIHATEPAELDGARLEGIALIMNNVKDATIISLANTGHMIQWDKPEEVASEIIKWVMKKEE
jgi:pimeloyl-ACP methyl ester carboxylesterase